MAHRRVEPGTQENLHLHEATRAAERATELTRQLLTLSRRQQPEKSPARVNDLLPGLAKLLECSLPPTIQLKLTTDPTVPALFLDEALLHQALLNLGINARDAMPDGGELTLKTELVQVDLRAAKAMAGDAAPGPFVRVTVSDTGEGIESDVLERIFEPFFTTKDRGKGDRPGPGHGLWLHAGT